MKRLDVALLVIGLLFVVVIFAWAAQSQLPAVLNTQTISECKPGERPTTHVCFDPSLPS